MPDLRLLANMNISPETVNALIEKGIDIVRVSQILPVTSSDQEILDRARRENRVVVTQDLDFSALLALGGVNGPSLITLRMSVSDPEAVTRKLLDLLLSESLILPSRQGFPLRKNRRGSHLK